MPSAIRLLGFRSKVSFYKKKALRDLPLALESEPEVRQQGDKNP